MGYEGGQSDRADIGNGVLDVNSAEPPTIDITPHNEMSYHNYFPSRIAFCGFKQARVGGITPLVDNRKVSKYMPDNLKEKMLNLGQFMHSVYQNKEAIGKEQKWYNTWQDSYHVHDKASMVKILERQKMNYQFYRNDWLRTWVTNPAHHYYEGELYFIQAIDNMSTTYYQFMSEYNIYPYNERPYYAAWGNGELLSNDEFYQLAQLYQKYQIIITYEPGDVFLLDNIKFKHGRSPYMGERRVGALMGDTVARKTEA